MYCQTICRCLSRCYRLRLSIKVILRIHQVGFNHCYLGSARIGVSLDGWHDMMLMHINVDILRQVCQYFTFMWVKIQVWGWFLF